MLARDVAVSAVGLTLAAALTTAGSGTGSGGNTSPTPVVMPSTIALSAPTPASGSTLTPVGTPPGTFFARGSGQFGVTVTITSGQDLPFAQLAVFLLTP